MGKGKIKIGDVAGNVIISSGQKGGTITQPSGSNLSQKRSVVKSIIVLISFLASVATLLAYCDLYPFKDSGDNVQFPTTVAKDSLPANNNKQIYNQINSPTQMNKNKENSAINVGDVAGNVVISQNQSGGITAHTVNIIRPLPRELNEEDKQNFIGIGKGYLIKICIIGGGESQAYGKQIVDFFRVEGYKVEVFMIGMYSPEPEPARYHLNENPNAMTVDIIIPKSGSF